ncbi:hypothetical protein [Streptomyces sp. NBC_00005]
MASAHRSRGLCCSSPGNPWLTAALVLSSAAILFLGVYAVLETLGLTPGS